MNKNDTVIAPGGEILTVVNPGSVVTGLRQAGRAELFYLPTVSLKLAVSA